MRRWVCDADMPGALVADEMGLGKTLTSVEPATICKLVTEKVVMVLPLSIILGEYPSRVGDVDAQRLSRHCRLRLRVVSTPEIEFSAPPAVGDTDNTMSQASSHYSGP
jgi:hypothetical protein